MFSVSYWNGYQWCEITTFNTHDGAKLFVKKEEEQDEYLTKVTGYSHTTDYRIEEV